MKNENTVTNQEMMQTKKQVTIGKTIFNVTAMFNGKTTLKDILINRVVEQAIQTAKS